MMKRIIVYGVFGLLLVTGGSIWWGLAWLLETSDGVTFLMREVSARTPVKIAARTVSGGIGRKLALEGVSVVWPSGEAAMDSLRIRWRLRWLPFGKVAVQELDLTGVRIHDRSPGTGQPPDLTIPVVTGIPGWLDAWVDRLKIDNLTYRHLDSPPVVITELSGALAWQHGQASALNLKVVTPQLRAQGMLFVGLTTPSLTATLALTPTQPVAGSTRFDLRTRLRPGRAPEQVAGTVVVTALSGTRKRLEISGEAGLARSVIALRGIKISPPGLRGSVTADGSVTLTTGAPRFQMTLRGVGLDLRQQAGTVTDLSGTISLAGTPETYGGRFDLVNKGGGWRSGRLTGAYAGSAHGVTFSGLDGALLGGTVRGNLRLGWAGGTTVAGSLQGNGLDPALITPEWSGVVNFDLAGNMDWTKGKPTGELRGRLRESRLRGRDLKGEVDARVTGTTVRIARLLLSGKGFTIHADGDLRQRLALTARIADLSGLVPGTAGTVDLAGWVRASGSHTTGELTGTGRTLAAEGLHLNTVDLAARLADRPDHPVALTARINGLKYQHLRIGSASLAVSGTMEHHRLELALSSAGAHVDLTASGGRHDRQWQGDVTRFTTRDTVGPLNLTAPARLSVSSTQITLSPLAMSGVGAERVELAGRVFFEPLHGGLNAVWRNLNLVRANQWLDGITLAGTSSGELTADSATGEHLALTARTRISGVITTPSSTVTITTATLDLEAGERGSRAGVEFRTTEGISVTGRFTSPQPARLGIPETGEIAATWQGVDLALLKSRIPPDITLTGTLSGALTGRLLTQGRLDLSGNVALAGGSARYRQNGGEITAAVKRAGLTWLWQGEVFSGDGSLVLADRGEATTHFRIPLSARLDTVLHQDGPVQGSFTGTFHERGALSVLLPGLVKESRGEVAFALAADGTWKTPRFSGTLALSQAGAVLPAAGITLGGVRLAAHLDGQRAVIDSFKAESGPGAITGTAELDLTGWRLAGYRGTLKGERFQMVRQPELTLFANPDLTFSGDLAQLTVRGAVLLPEVMVNNPTKNLVMPSNDVVVIRSAVPVRRAAPLALDARIKIVLGKKVIIKAEGLDAQVEGGVDLIVRGRDDVKGSGEIKVTKGRYSIYGVTLDITRGRVMFAGGPVQQPALDILALREVDNVKAGVTITGTPENPVIVLYSDPAMPDVDILSYVVLGKKLGSSEEKTDLLASVASVLVSSGQSVFLQEQIKERLGLDTIGFSSTNDGASGYKQVERTLGPSPVKQNVNTLSETMLQVGKFLTPKLYVSYGWSMFSDTHQVKIRYNITKQWEVETRTGTTATGGDLFYRIELE